MDPEAGRFFVRAIRTAFVGMAIVIVLLAAAVVILLIGGPVGHVVAIRTAGAAPVVLTNPPWRMP